jgi:hypothetical protein
LCAKIAPPLLRTSLQINHALYDEPGFDAAAVAFDCLLAKAAAVVGRALIAARRHAVAAPHTLVVISLAPRRGCPRRATATGVVASRLTARNSQRTTRSHDIIETHFWPLDGKNRRMVTERLKSGGSDANEINKAIDAFHRFAVRWHCDVAGKCGKYPKS